MELKSFSNLFTKRQSLMVKYFAISYMVLLHTFASPDWYITGSPTYRPRFIAFCSSFKLCVAIYAFMNGYGFYCSNKKGLRNSCKKIIRFLICYWLILFSIFFPAILLYDREQVSLKKTVINLFGLYPNWNYFAWYVYFYIFLMLFLPLITKWRLNGIKEIAVGIIGAYLVEVTLHSLPMYSTNILISDLFDCFLYFPCVWIGYCCAKYSLFNYVYQCRIFRKESTACTLIILMLISRLYLPSILGFLLDVVYAPITIYSIILLGNELEKRKYGKIISNCMCYIGGYSTEIWFLHAVFFSACTRNVFQPLLFIVSFPPVVYTWEIILCLPIAIFYNKVSNSIYKGFRLLAK